MSIYESALLRPTTLTSTPEDEIDFLDLNAPPPLHFHAQHPPLYAPDNAISFLDLNAPPPLHFGCQVISEDIVDFLDLNAPPAVRLDPFVDAEYLPCEDSRISFLDLGRAMDEEEDEEGLRRNDTVFEDTRGRRVRGYTVNFVNYPRTANPLPPWVPV